MNYSEIMQALQQASSFDLYRLRAAISHQLESPERILDIRSQLQIGQEVELFNEETNRAEKAVIRKFNPSSVAVTLLADQARWRVPYYWINLEGTDVTLKNTAKRGIDKNALSVGDSVGFHSSKGYEVYGEIIRLNPKTVTLNTPQGKWRVSYALLFPVVDSPELQANWLGRD